MPNTKGCRMRVSLLSVLLSPPPTVSVATKGCLVKQNTINKTWQQPEYLTCPAFHTAATPCQQPNKNKNNKKRNKKTRLPQKSDKGLPGAADSVPDSVCSAPKIKHVEHQLCGVGAGAGAGAASSGRQAGSSSRQ